MIRTLAALVLLLAFGGPTGAQTVLEQMRDLLDRGYYNSAARVIGPDLVAAEPDNPEAHFLHARALYLTGDVTASRRALDAAMELEGADVDPRVNHLDGLLRAAEGDLEAGLRLLRNAFVRSGRYDHAMDWGRVAWQAYRLDEALQAFDEAAGTEAGQRSPWPHLNRGRLLVTLGRRDDAIEAFRTAIEVFEQYDLGEARPSPAYVEAYYRLGEIYEETAEAQDSDRFLQLAADHYRAALTGDPNYAPAIEALDSLSRRLP